MEDKVPATVNSKVGKMEVFLLWWRLSFFMESLPEMMGKR